MKTLFFKITTLEKVIFILSILGAVFVGILIPYDLIINVNINLITGSIPKLIDFILKLTVLDIAIIICCLYPAGLVYSFNDL